MKAFTSWYFFSQSSSWVIWVEVVDKAITRTYGKRGCTGPGRGRGVGGL